MLNGNVRLVGELEYGFSGFETSMLWYIYALTSTRDEDIYCTMSNVILDVIGRRIELGEKEIN